MKLMKLLAKSLLKLKPLALTQCYALVRAKSKEKKKKQMKFYRHNLMLSNPKSKTGTRLLLHMNQYGPLEPV